MWYFLYFSANCNAKKIDIKNMSIKRDAVARCAGPQMNHCSTAGVEFVFDGSNADVLFFSYFSKNNCILLHIATAPYQRFYIHLIWGLRNMLACPRKPPTQESPEAINSSLKNSSNKLWPEENIVLVAGAFLSNAMSVKSSALRESPSRARKYCPGQRNCVWSKCNRIT